MTAIQESNCKRINTPKLFEHFKDCNENLSTDSDGLRINRGYVYNQVNNVFEGINVIDMAIDRCGTLYLVDRIENDDKQTVRQNLYRFNANEKILETIGSAEKIFSLGLQTISAIGVDDDTIYIADYFSKDSDNQTEIVASRLIALTKNDLQIRWVLSIGPDGRALNKIHAIQCDNRGKTYILEECEKRILYIDTFDVCFPTFRPLELPIEPDKVDFKPQNLAASINGTIYILFLNNKHIGNALNERKGFGLNETKGVVLKEIKGYILKVRLIGNEISIEEIKPEITDFSPSGITVDILNQIFIGQSKYTLGESRPDIPLPIRKLSNDIVNAWTPLQTYKFINENPVGSSRKLVSDSKGHLYIINNGNKLTLLEREELNLQNKKGYFEGTYISKPIDSQTFDTHWHRLLLEGKFETGTQIDFEYFVSNVKDEGPKDSESKKWHKCVSKASAIQGDEKRDALFIDNARGRYLWFKITLSGDETLSPVIKSVAVFFPRISYLDYLPGIYQEDSVSKELLERFLAIFESIFYEIDFTIDHISRYFDTSGAPAEFLSWLGSWLDVPMDEDWPEDKKRLFIRNAISLYKRRGTRECLEESIELFTGQKPFVVESFQAAKACKGNISQPCNDGKTISFPSQERIFFPPADLKVKDCYENKTSENEGKEELLIDRLYGTDRFSFYVLLSGPDLDETSRSRVMRIIDEQKPVHTSCELKVLKPMFYLDMHTYLEVNTVVTEPKFVVGKTSIIGRDTVLHDEEKAGQIEKHSRLGVDILLS